MSNKNVTLQDGISNSLYPKTFDYNVYNSNNESLDNVLRNKVNYSEDNTGSTDPSPFADYYNKSYIDNNIYTKSEILNITYPVGSIYISVNSTNPQTLFGGTWVQLKDTFLLAHGNTYTSVASQNSAQVTSEAGEATHILTENEMPSHTHTFECNGSSNNNGTWRTPDGGNYKGYATNVTTNSTGGGAAHNNMPPYLVVYMFKRIS